MARRLALGELPDLPWIAFDVVARLDGLLEAHSSTVSVAIGARTP